MFSVFLVNGRYYGKMKIILFSIRKNMPILQHIFCNCTLSWELQKIFNFLNEIVQFFYKVLYKVRNTEIVWVSYIYRCVSFWKGKECHYISIWHPFLRTLLCLVQRRTFGSCCLVSDNIISQLSFQIVYKYLQASLLQTVYGHGNYCSAKNI